MTRQEIETAIAGILNRDDLAIQIPIWLATAYRTIQRRHNFQVMETVVVIPAVGASLNYAVPIDLKKPRVVFWADTVNGNRPVRFLSETSLENILVVSEETIFDPISDDDESWHYAITNNLINLWPATPVEITGRAFVFYYWKWKALPTLEESDWFTENAFDYLIYKALEESAPFLVDDDRIKLWRDMYIIKYNEVIAADIDSRQAGEAVMRG